MLTQEKLRTPKTKYRAIQLLAVGLLIFMYDSNLTAETIVPEKNKTLVRSKTTLKNDQMNLVDRVDLIKESKKYKSQIPPPNIIDNIEYSKGNYSIIFAYIILGLFACLFVFSIIYIIHDIRVLSRREWIQRSGEPEHEYQPDSLTNLSLQTNAKSTSQTDIDPS